MVVNAFRYFPLEPRSCYPHLVRLIPQVTFTTRAAIRKRVLDELSLGKEPPVTPCRWKSVLASARDINTLAPNTARNATVVIPSMVELIGLPPGSAA